MNKLSQINIRIYLVIIVMIITITAILISNMINMDNMNKVYNIYKYQITDQMPSVNALQYYIKASRIIPIQGNPFPLSDYGVLSSQSLCKKILEVRPQVEDLYEQSLQYRYKDPQLKSFSDKFSFCVNIYNLARYFIIINKYELKHNKNISMSDNLKAIKLGKDLYYGASNLDMLVGISCQKMGQELIYSSINKMTIAECLANIKYLESLDYTQSKFVDIIENEKKYQINCVINLCKESNWRDILLKKYYSSSKIANIDLALFTSKKQIIYDLANYHDSCMYIIKNGYTYTNSLKLKNNENKYIKYDGITENCSLSWLSYLANEARERMTILRLALQIYYLKNHEYPSSLDLLIKAKYISSIPEDPFAINEPIKYYVINNSFRLYSIGPDAIDDHGKSIQYKNKLDFFGALITLENGVKGDYVYPN